MTDQTVLVVDADHETQETMVSTLESEGYLVFTASGRDVSTGLAEKISPALIFLQPAAISVEGFATCKAIHNSPKFRKIPIILLASLKGPLDPRYVSFYGVVDYLRLPLDPDEVSNKTSKILAGSSRDFDALGDDFNLAAAENIPSEDAIREEPRVSGPGYKMSSQDIQPPEDEFALQEDEVPVQDEKKISRAKGQIFDTESDEVSDIGQPNEDYRYHEAHERIKESFYNKGARKRSVKTGILIPVVIVAAVLAVILGGFTAYKFFMSSPKVTAPVAASRPQPLPQKQSELPPLQQDTQKQVQTAVKTLPAETKEVPVKEAPVAPDSKKGTPVVPEKKSDGQTVFFRAVGGIQK